jgi:hypothetical protein
MVTEPGDGDIEKIKEQFNKLALYQAIGGTFCLVTFLAFHRETRKSYALTTPLLNESAALPDTLDSRDDSSFERQSKILVTGPQRVTRPLSAARSDKSEEGSEGPEIPFGPALKILAGNPQFLMQMFCFAALGGVSYAIPAVQDLVFTQVSHKKSRRM